MAKKYRYQLYVNKKGLGKNYKEFVYKYGKSEGIKLIVAKNCAYVDVMMGVKKEFDDFSYVRFNLMIDALKKIYLLHMLIFKQGLNISKMILYIDDECKEFNKNDERFPYVFSMVEDVQYHFSDEWANERMLESILCSTKSSRMNEYKFVSLYSYLTAQAKKYNVDRFTNLWTAFNAYYANLAKLDELDPSKDKVCIEHLLFSIGHGTSIKSKRFRDTHKGLYERIGTELSLIPHDYYKEFYNRLLNKEDIEGFEVLKEVCDDTITFYGFILCEYAYYLRCKYFHGNRTITLLSTYNEREVCILRLLCYFLDRFLIENIPGMFK